MAPRCVGTVSVYSGRPDPEWPLGARQVDALRRAWQRLPPRAVIAPQPPALGYRGVTARCTSGEEWRAFGGAVSYRDVAGSVAHRQDDRRRFEKTLLATAPEGAVPRGIPDIDELMRS